MSTISTESNAVRSFNLGLFISMLVIFILGVITLYSAARGAGLAGIYKTQMVWFLLAMSIGAILYFIDMQILEKISYPFYAVCLILLVMVLVIGKVGGGSQRWLDLKLFHLQPSEVAKMAIVFVLARYFSTDRHQGAYTLRTLIVPGLLVAPFFILILMQPDLGTAGVLFLIASSMIFFLGVHFRSIALVVVVALITVPLAYRFVLRDYQRERVKTFIDPGRDAKGSGYNALQCKIAVGSGRLFGKGYMKGTQAQLNFIPEQHTDFIFSVYAEERGFLGGLLLLVLYGSYCFFAIATISRARDKFEMLLALGLTSIIFWHVFINMGMVIGVLPIVGVGLPFFSYGGTSLVTFVSSTALLLNLSRKRYIF